MTDTAEGKATGGVFSVLRLMLVLAVGAKLVVAGVWGQSALAQNVAPARPTAPMVKPAQAADAERELGRLLEVVQAREAELDAREEELQRREERLEIFEKDVTEKLASLEAIERRLGSRAKAASAKAEESAVSLAKIYGAMKPNEAAPLLDQLDQRTILQIFGRMKEKQISAVLPLLSREKAIEITQRLASRY